MICGMIILVRDILLRYAKLAINSTISLRKK